MAGTQDCRFNGRKGQKLNCGRLEPPNRLRLPSKFSAPPSRNTRRLSISVPASSSWPITLHGELLATASPQIGGNQSILGPKHRTCTRPGPSSAKFEPTPVEIADLLSRSIPLSRGRTKFGPILTEVGRFRQVWPQFSKRTANIPKSCTCLVLERLVIGVAYVVCVCVCVQGMGSAVHRRERGVRRRRMRAWVDGRAPLASAGGDARNCGSHWPLGPAVAVSGNRRLGHPRLLVGCIGGALGGSVPPVMGGGRHRRLSWAAQSAAASGLRRRVRASAGRAGALS